MELELQGKRALVTGASAGIGRATVLGLAREGCAVAFCGRRRSLLEEVAETAREAGAPAVAPLEFDLRRQDAIGGFVDEAATALGGLDIVVNSAGASAFGDFLDIPVEKWAEDIELKLLGYVRVCRAAVPHLRKAGGGRIVNIAGIAGKVPQPWHLPGGAANAAVMNFSVALAADLAKHRINVVALSPGPVETDRLAEVMEALGRRWGVSTEEATERFTKEQPLGRLGRPEEIADAITFLVSARAAFITGTLITIDGGQSRWI